MSDLHDPGFECSTCFHSIPQASVRCPICGAAPAAAIAEAPAWTPAASPGGRSVQTEIAKAKSVFDDVMEKARSAAQIGAAAAVEARPRLQDELEKAKTLLNGVLASSRGTAKAGWLNAVKAAVRPPTGRPKPDA